MIALIELWFLTIWAFVAIMHAKALNDKGQLSLFWRLNLYPLAIIGVLLDMCFNVVIGSIIFCEVPREFLFTHRVHRHTENTGWRRRLAEFWSNQLNQIDPGHV